MRIGAALAVAIALSMGLAAQQPQGPTFKAGTQVVSLFVTVQDAQKRLVPDLTQQDFEVADNDKPQAITSFRRPCGLGGLRMPYHSPPAPPRGPALR